MSLLIEKVFPYVFALGAGGLWFFLDIKFPVEKDILAASLTVGAILTGFLATAKALLLTLDTPIMQRIKDTDYWLDLSNYLKEAIWSCFLLCTFPMLGYFLDTKQSLWFGELWVMVAVLAACSFVRVTNIILKIISHPDY